MCVPTSKIIGRKKMLEYKLPENAKELLRYIDAHGPRTQKQLYRELDLTLRALRYSLEKLERVGLLVKRPNLIDMRSLYYVLTIESCDIGQILSESVTSSGEEALA
ncbi:MAG: helix-turn-helix transcriptional regulator [Candidatus Heimdallarchaeota archaeon]|nr:helix-turn-helix transcriptional regulator [Candidatus Heimdallarchaeota archaeon]